MRLTYLLIENEPTNQPEVNALLSLMCFHTSRFKARKNEKGEMILYEDQDETLWNQELITKGVYFLDRASHGKKISKYHIEASIAYWDTNKANTIEKWENILTLYNQLLILEYSPIAALNRTFALAKVRGKEVAIKEAEKLKLIDNPFYFTLLGELYQNIDDIKSQENFKNALSLAVTKADQQVIQKRINKF
jgi:RNA polymerase sigma-70 factor (ECF subfamily)